MKQLLLKSARELQDTVNQARREGRRICFVPTMGALHEGHRSLFRTAKKQGDLGVVSIFVNPTQFNSAEDLKNYPRTLEQDLELCEQEGVDLVFTPTEQEIYPKGLVTDIPLPAVAGPMEGEFRPGHFDGVCAVVARLLQIIQPDKAYFGEKDFQQLRVIEEMVKEQKIPVEIVRCPTVRDKNGLALSSRNVRLSPEGYQQALAIPRAIKAAQAIWRTGARNAPSPAIRRDLPRLSGEFPESPVLHAAKEELADLKVDYVTIAEARIFIAAWAEEIRLIDNDTLNPLTRGSLHN